MFSTGDFVISSTQFNSEHWGARTAEFVVHISTDLKKKHWNGIYAALASYSVKVEKEHAVKNSAPAPRERVPLPSSDPPSPPPQ